MQGVVTNEKQAPDAVEGGNGGTRVIKRYSNRKLYDTEQSKYVTLDEISTMIKAGDEVQIIDNESKEDLTSVTLTQIIYEEEKRENRMPLGMLRNLIQTGGATLHEFFERSLKTPVAEIKDTAEHRVDEIRKSALNLRDVATKSVTELTDTARRIFSREERRAEEFRRTTSNGLEELIARIELRIAEIQLLNEQAQKISETPAAEDTPTDRERRPPSSVPSVLVRTLEHTESLVARLEVAREKLGDLMDACAAMQTSDDKNEEEPTPSHHHE
ncbi:MAG: hypothetical protein IPK13_09230 [Deltaproteobacteria bacterium]|nr:hypothetical protein [Deltaproteobacteria bacterium]